MNYTSIYRDGLFQDQVALVTGGGTGIGLCIATELAVLGATVVIAGRDVTKCQAAADAVNAKIAQRIITMPTVDAVNAEKTKTKQGKLVVGPSTNIRKPDEVQALVTHIVDTYGALHLLVNNAGGQFISPAAALSPRGFAAVVDTNLTGTFLVAQQAFLQYMQEHGGSIVNITLVNRNGLPGMAHSAAARAAVENLTRTLAWEWMEYGVRVNCVRPGIIWTDSGFEAYGDAGEEFLAKLLPAVPAKRLGTAAEVSAAVVWLLSQGAAYVTGTAVAVDGGAGAITLPLMDIPNQQHLPTYGEELPAKARL